MFLFSGKEKFFEKKLILFVSVCCTTSFLPQTQEKCEVKFFFLKSFYLLLIWEAIWCETEREREGKKEKNKKLNLDKKKKKKSNIQIFLFILLMFIPLNFIKWFLL